MVGSCEHGNELSVLITVGNLFISGLIVSFARAFVVRDVSVSPCLKIWLQVSRPVSSIRSNRDADTLSPISLPVLKYSTKLALSQAFRS
jgi:hypothetical protein